MPWGTSSGNSSSVPPPPLIRLLLHRFFDHRLFYGYPSKDSPVENSSENRGSNGLQGDLVAQSLDAAGGPPDRGLAVPFIKVVTAQISIGSAVSQQMIDNDQNTVGHCQDGSLGASSCCQPVVLGRQVALFGTGCTPGCFYQGRTQPGVAMPSVPILAFASALIIPRADLGPGRKVALGGKAAHISTQFGQNLFSSPMPGTASAAWIASSKGPLRCSTSWSNWAISWARKSRCRSWLCSSIRWCGPIIPFRA